MRCCSVNFLAHRVRTSPILPSQRDCMTVRWIYSQSFSSAGRHARAVRPKGGAGEPTLFGPAAASADARLQRTAARGHQREQPVRTVFRTAAPIPRPARGTRGSPEQQPPDSSRLPSVEATAAHAASAAAAGTPAASAHQETPTDAYSFPVHRALRYVRVGRHYHRRNDGRRQRLASFLAQGADRQSDPPHPLAPAARRGGAATSPTFAFPLLSNEHAAEGSHGHPGRATPQASWADRAGHAEDAAGSALLQGAEFEVLSDAPLVEEKLRVEEVTSFANYHAHHVVSGFRHARAALKRRQQQQRRQERRGPRRALLTTEEVERLLKYQFQASVLLHVTGLFGVAEKYIESLLDVCLSGSAFLSEHYNAWRHQGLGRRPRGAYHSPHRSRPPLSSCASALGEGGAAPAEALHWAAVHFTEGVQLWGLLEHTEPLFPPSVLPSLYPPAHLAYGARRGHGQTGGDGAPATPPPTGVGALAAKLLQTQAGLLLQLTRRRQTEPAAPRDPRRDHRATNGSQPSRTTATTDTGDAADRDEALHLGEDVRLDATTVHALQSILGGAAAQASSHAVAHWFGVPTSSGDPPVSFYPQQRLLQLLPLLWLTMMLNHLSCSAASPVARNRTATVRAGRHAFLRVLRLFAADMGPEVSVWVLAALLYSNSAFVSSVEVAAMLSTGDRCGALRTRHAGDSAHAEGLRGSGATRGSPAGEQGSGEWSVARAGQNVSASALLDWLHRLRRGASPPPRPTPRRDRYLSERAHDTRPSASAGAQHELGDQKSRKASAPPLGSAHQLYMALLNIPVCCCGPSESYAIANGEGMAGTPPASAGAPTTCRAQLTDGINADLRQDGADDTAASLMAFFDRATQPQWSRRTPSGPQEALVHDMGAAATAAALNPTGSLSRAETVPRTGEGLLFVNELLLRVLLQWRCAKLSWPRSPASQPAGVSPARDSRVAPSSAHGALSPLAKSVTSYLEELTLLLEAALHVRELHRRVQACRGESTLRPRASSATAAPLAGAAPQGAAIAQSVAHSLQATARALAGQLGSDVLPSRMNTSFGLTPGGLTGADDSNEDESLRVERELLTATHAVLMEVILGRAASAEELAQSLAPGDGAHAMLMGELHPSYQRTMRELLSPAQTHPPTSSR